MHTTIQLPFSLYIMRNNFEAVPRELEEAAVIDGGGPLQVLRRVFLPALVPAIVTVALFAFITSWNEFLGAIVMMSKESAFTLPVILAAARTETSLGGTDWGMLQAGRDDLDHPVRPRLPAAPALLRVGPAQGAVK